MTLTNGDTTLEAAQLSLHALDFEPEPECDYSKETCPQQATWRTTCTISGCWGLLCNEHMRTVKAHQEWADRRRGGQRCNGCDKEARELLRFDPIISPDEERLW